MGGSHYSSFAIKTDGTLWAWGDGNQGVLANNDGSTDYSSPIQIPGTNWSKIISGGYSMMAIKTDGTLWTWGAGSDGQLGDSNKANRSSPIQIPGTTWSGGGAFYQAFRAVKTDGTMWAWGANHDGNLAQNDSAPSAARSSPIQIPGTTWTLDNITGYRVSRGFAFKEV